MSPSHNVECRLCGRTDGLVAQSIGLCVSCIRSEGGKVLTHVLEGHREVRGRFGLPGEPPKDAQGIPCRVCALECSMASGQIGYCGLRVNRAGRLLSLSTPERGLYYSYLDPHVTNCCGAFFCPAGTGRGYPKYACCDGPELGYFNLAVFFYGCNFDCLFCQNHSHKQVGTAPAHTTEDLVHTTLNNKRISCWCFFGGSPEPQLPFAINASKRVLEGVPDSRILRICFEWNGCGNTQLAKRAGELAFTTGGNIKFDLKCRSENLSYALSGVSNRRAYENFAMIAEEFRCDRKHPPPLCATTLMVPGYVDEEEVEGIARFIADLDPEIPYSLLVFHPDFAMRDLPITPLGQAAACYAAAKRHLRNVNVGNLYLLGHHAADELARAAP